MEKKIVDILKQNHQEQLLEFLPILTPEEEEKLEQQIEKINFEQLQQLYESTKQKPQIEEKKIEPIKYVDKYKLDQAKKEELENIGRKIISSGQYAVITMAGGQGTRLGHKGPKGTYALETVNGKKYLFEIIVDTLKKAQKEYGVTIPWYIMTSKENHAQTVKFLEEKQFFSYDSQKVKFFVQGELPLIDTNGKVILDQNKTIKEAADGNGGIYEAIAQSEVLSDMKQKNTQWIFVSNVDNVLSNFVDPLLLGLTVKQNQKIGAKSVVKTNPKEKVGVFCKMNGKPKIIEYIDLPEEMAEERDEDGELFYGEVNIGNYLFHRSVLENLADVKLPYHAAFKKSGFLKPNGEFVEPNEPNVYKFEAFIFDSFVRYDDITILRGKREEEFAPVKNKEGNDSPETATKLYNRQQ